MHAQTCRHSGGRTAPLEKGSDDHPNEHPEPARSPADPGAGQARRRMDQLQFLYIYVDYFRAPRG
jgi:hypothetical protein